MLINQNYLMKRKALQGFDFLPLFYALPQPLVKSRRQDHFPRNPFTVITNNRWRKLYHSTGWRAEIADMWALTIWPYLGIRGGFSNYSFRDPFVLLACSLPLWASYLAIIGISLDNLAMFPDNAEAQYLTEAQTDKLCKDMAKIFWYDPYTKAKQMLEIVQEHRDHKDFSDRKSTVRIDFHRKYYHTRTKNKTVPLYDAWEEAEYIEEADYDLQNVISNEWVNKFYGWLGSKKDIDICKLRYIGCTQQQIAEILGYKNHSGVNKRLAYISDILKAFVEWQHDLEQDKDAPPPPELSEEDDPPVQPGAEPKKQAVKYDMIEFSYKRR